jgi:hypothetical protein
MTMEAEKHIDSEIDALFCSTLWMRDTVPITTVDCFTLIYEGFGPHRFDGFL